MPTISFMLLLICTTILNVVPTEADELKTYIVHLNSSEAQQFSESYDHLEEWYNSFLSKITSNSNEKPKMVHAYHHVIIGFAAKMSPEQANEMENLDKVLLVKPESVYKLHTTRSPHFLGLRKDSGLWKESNYGKGTIVAILDTGITPYHPSFDDKGVPPPPARWKGKCEVAGCNNKLIGMRSFVDGSSPTDKDGHGTHTSSTAAGNAVANASVFDNAEGTASGVAPLAHVAMYKICGELDCTDSATLAGMDAAIEEGADVLSLSLGGPSVPFYSESIAIGAFAAIQKGVFVSCSAGNSGPREKTLSNEAPWILTVGASYMDRRIRTTVSLGNEKLVDGVSLYQPKNFIEKVRPLVYPAENGYSCDTLDQVDVKGKVVLCDVDYIIVGTGFGEVVKKAGGAAIILANDNYTGESLAVERQVLPSSHVGYKEGVEIKKYLNSTQSPVVTIIQRGTVLNVKTAPEVVGFTSRGPNSASPGILKPDTIGPGVDILAAWPESVDKTKTKKTFNIIHGTSMSCPHLAGIAALLKTAHPEWSPAAIKSAIMTTATQVSLNGRAILDQRDLPADVLAMGSGHVNASKASDPGLIFDIQPDDYILYLCGLGYSPKQVQLIVKKAVSCSKTIPKAQLNYPSFAVTLKRGEYKTYSRTVTNVGNPNSNYTIGDIVAPQGVNIVVGSNFQELSFTDVQKKLMYEVTFSRDSKDGDKDRYGEGYMTWVSGKYSVRTPFSFKFE